MLTGIVGRCVAPVIAIIIVMPGAAAPHSCNIGSFGSPHWEIYA
jgi:hypothetical protein